MVINAGVDNPAVSTGLMLRQIVFLLDDDDLDSWLVTQERTGGGDSYNPTAYDRVVIHQTQNAL